MHLTLRLKALEADRNLMKQTIESLRRENGEMKLLQEIAQQLQELRGLEQKDLRQQSKPLAAASPCQVSWIDSVLPKMISICVKLTPNLEQLETLTRTDDFSELSGQT